MPEQYFTAPRQTPHLELRTTLDSALPYAEHLHNAFCVGAVTGGRTEMRLGNASYTVQQGELVLIAPKQPHSCNPIDGMPRSYHMLFIDPAWLADHVVQPLFNARAVRVALPVVQDKRLYNEFIAWSALFGQARQDCLFSFAEAEQGLLRFIAAMQKRHGCLTPALPARSALLASLDAVLGADGYAEPDGRAGASVSRAARGAGMRRESFSRSVRKQSGLPPCPYLHCLRLERAKQLLKSGMSLSEAALASGFADQSHFHRMFVKYYSATPGRYRKALSHSFKK